MIADVVNEYLAGLEADTRRVAADQWGITLADVGGWPLHVGVSLRDGFLRVQGEALAAGVVSDHELLARNRGLLLVRYAHTGAGAVWVHGELPSGSVTSEELDRLLGFLVEAVLVARHRADAAR